MKLKNFLKPFTQLAVDEPDNLEVEFQLEPGEQPLRLRNLSFDVQRNTWIVSVDLK